MCLAAITAMPSFRKRTDYLIDCYYPLKCELDSYRSIDNFSKLKVYSIQLSKETERCNNPKIYTKAEEIGFDKGCIKKTEALYKAFFQLRSKLTDAGTLLGIKNSSDDMVDGYKECIDNYRSAMSVYLRWKEGK